jgi:hypothetical protein
MLVSCLAYSSTMKMEATPSSKTSNDFRSAIQHYIPEAGTLHLPLYFYFTLIHLISTSVHPLLPTFFYPPTLPLSLRVPTVYLSLLSITIPYWSSLAPPPVPFPTPDPLLYTLLTPLA